ncbi:TRAM/LAG1/CLN8 homology domain [Ceraceosorus bombacis]|uniref:TRAM/LAG1/CLN8 homology domain n=1 Tax=Ceraceosorus bombacis TaxID=401625 RepID=A0A0N7L937_9BASI|nr:TRAM/LAG1/CLN8 homology domain [Ceraceosorus bombacis]
MVSIVPEGSLLRDESLHQAFYASLLIQHSLFHTLSATTFKGEGKDMLKKRAWILTTFNGLVMTLASLPFLFDLLLSGFDFHAVKHRRWLEEPASAFFVAYLLSDLGLGSIFYRKLINFSSGWAHHTAYTLLFAYWVHRGWALYAVMACVFELPTFIMGLASLVPQTRSNNAFTITFFITRVFFHFGLLCASVTAHGRATPGIDGSWGVANSIIATYPMHLWWGYKCIMSVRRRMKRRAAEKKERAPMLNEAGRRLSAARKEEGYFSGFGQLMNGLAPPDTSSALNTPAATPGSVTPPARAESPFGYTAPVALHAAGIGVRRASTASSSSEVSALSAPSTRRSIDGEASSSSLDVRPSPHSFRRHSMQGPPSALHENKSKQRLFTAPVPPIDAGPGAREPFLAIRSPAEAKDRARRLVADAVRKVWISAPNTWRAQFEAEAEAGARLRAAAAAAAATAKSNDEGAGRRASLGASEDSTSAEETDADAGVSGREDEDAMEQTRAQRARAAARRAIIRAVRRAINGKDADGLDEARLAGVSAGVLEDPSVDLDSVDGAARSRQQSLMEDATSRTINALDLQQLLKFVPPLPPDMTGKSFDVRPLEVEQVEGQRRKRWVNQLRRRMEVQRRGDDFVLW